EKHPAIAGRGLRTLTCAEECHAAAEFLRVRIAREDSAVRRVKLRDHMRLMADVGRSKNPLDVPEDAELPRLPRILRKRQQLLLHRIGGVDEHVQLMRDS